MKSAIRALVVASLVFGGAAGAQLPASIEFRVPKPPTVAAGDSGAFLAYELHVTNLTMVPVTLKRVEVLSASRMDSALLILEDSVLLRTLTRQGASVPAAERAQLGAGARATVFLWVPVPKSNPPSAVRHRLTFQRDTSGSTQVLEGAAVPVERNIVRIRAPLRGRWVAANGPSNASGHRRSAIALNGTVAIAQRFGIDFLQVDDSGSSFRGGDRSKNENSYAYGKEVLAVADGIVVQTKDSIPDNTGGPQSRAVPITLVTIGGNHIVLDIGHGHYAFYAHLQPGSLRVRLGDRVKRGQVIGLVGNSGNSTEPHLHFHVVDAIVPGTSTLGAEGIPYALPSFELVGRCPRIVGECVKPASPLKLEDAMPMQNQLVRFPDR